jgi:hypothetical protein
LCPRVAADAAHARARIAIMLFMVIEVGFVKHVVIRGKRRVLDGMKAKGARRTLYTYSQSEFFRLLMLSHCTRAIILLIKDVIDFFRGSEGFF